jgi:hypothetical protein
MKMFQMVTAKKVLLLISEVIKKQAAPSVNWDLRTISMWLNFFLAGFSFLGCTNLRLENFPASKQATIKEQ